MRGLQLLAGLILQSAAVLAKSSFDKFGHGVKVGAGEGLEGVVQNW